MIGVNLDNSMDEALEGISANLRRLRIKDCNIRSIPSSAFSQLHMLEKLELEYMDIRHINNSAFRYLGNLTYLFLHGLNISALDQHLDSDLKALERLIIRNCPINKFPQLNHMQRLYALALEGVMLHHLEYASFPNNSFLRYILIKDSQLVHLFGEAANDTTINCTVLPFRRPLVDTIGKFSKLNSLNLGGNNLKLLPKNFYYVGNITRLLLSHNELETLPNDVFCGLSKLKHLTLNYNRIEYLQKGVFSHLISLRTLKLDNNNIMTPDEGTFSPLINLISLDLAHNRISSLTREWFIIPKYLFLKNNHLACRCDLFWIKELNYTWRGPKYKFTSCINTTKVTVFDFLEKSCCKTEPAPCSSTVKIRDGATYNKMLFNIIGIVGTGLFLIIFAFCFTIIYIERRTSR